MEHTVYDSDGQLITATFNDYAMPRADDLPALEFQTRNVPCKWNPLGIRARARPGTIAATPAVMNAVVDALPRHGIRNIDMRRPLRFASGRRSRLRRREGVALGVCERPRFLVVIAGLDPAIRSVTVKSSQSAQPSSHDRRRTRESGRGIALKVASTFKSSP